MEAIGSGLGALFGGGGGGWLKAIPELVLGGLGTYSNIRKTRQQDQILRDYLANQKRLRELTPEQHLAGIRGFQQPLFGGLTAGVGNLVQAAMGERGLSQAPGIFAEAMAQVLAPYFQQSQGQAQEAWFRSLGLGDDFIKATSAIPQGQSTAGIWREVLRKLFPASGTGAGSVGLPPIDWPTSPDLPGILLPPPVWTPLPEWGGGSSGLGGVWDPEHVSGG